MTSTFVIIGVMSIAVGSIVLFFEKFKGSSDE